MEKRIRISISALLVAVVCLAVVAQVIAQPSPFVISSWITVNGGEPCNNPYVEITNTNTSKSWNAENQSTSNYYQLVLNGSGDVCAGNLLMFNVSGCSQFKTVNYTVKQSEIDNGGIFEFNISLEAPVTPEPDLIITKIALKTPGYVNEENILGVTVKNTGSADAGSFNVSLSVDGTRLGNQTVSSLGADSSTEVEFTWTPTKAGGHVLSVTADWNNEVEESDEANNTLSKTLWINKRTDWLQFHYDKAHVGFSPSEAPDTNEIAWVSGDIGAEPLSSLIVANGKVLAYCPGLQIMDSNYTYLVALNESNGEILWTTLIAPQEYGSWATPAYTDGSVFVSSGDRFYRIGADTGEIEWVFKFPGGHGSVNGGPVVTSRAVYVGDWSGYHYYCIDKNNGTEIWNFTVSGYSQSVPAIAYGNAYFGSAYLADNRVYCVDAESGKEVWNTSFSADKNVCGSVTIADNIVYLTTYDFNGTGIFYALDAFNGTEIWSATIEPTDSTPAYYPSPCKSVRGYIYTAGGGSMSSVGTSAVRCLDTKTGDLIWRVPGLGSWTNSPVVTKDGKVFVGKECSGGGIVPGYCGLYCLDAFTGKEKWHSEQGGSSPVVVNGIVYTIGEGRVLAFGNGTLPDLTVEATAPDNEYVVEKRGNITATIENIGKSNVTESFKVGLRKKGEVIAEQTVNPPLNISNPREVVFEWIPEEPGENRLIVEVDPSPGNVTESNPWNNIGNVTVNVESSNEFDTGKGTYPSISGTHYGKIIPDKNITANWIYTYPCAGTGGHSESIEIWNETTGECAVAEWGGYVNDYHNLSFNTTLNLQKDIIYSYIIKTGSYPQIIHAPYKQVTGGNITCTRFEDVNGKEYNDWIPAIRLSS